MNAWSSNYPAGRSIRFKHFDYTAHGAYFITIVTHGRRPLFGDVEEDHVHLNTVGQMIEEEWLRTAELRANVVLDDFVIMPNHIHGIIFLSADDGAEGMASEFRRVTPGSVSAVVRAFKAAATRRLRKELGSPDLVLWQKNYFERVVRSERHLATIRQYVADNPRRWALDRENPANEHPW